MNPWLDALIAAAKGGDDVAARTLVGYLAVCLEHGQVPPGLVEYFAPAFRRVASGRSADSALNTGAKGNFSRDYEIAQEVWKLNHSDKGLHLRDNKCEPGAYSVVGKKFSMTADNVERIYKSMKWVFDAEAFDMKLEPGEDCEGPEIPKEVREHLTVDMQLAFAKLFDALKK